MSAHALQRKLEKAIQCVERGAHKQAVPLLRDLARKAPGHPIPRNLLGLIAIERGKYDDAARHFEKAAAIAPGDPDFHSNLGEARRKAGRTEQAVESFERALALKPDHASAHSNLGAALLALDRPVEAAAHLETAIHLNPRGYQAYTNLGLVLTKQRKADEALPLFERAWRLSAGDGELAGHFGRGLLHVGQVERALELIRSALKRWPDRVELRILEASLLERLGSFADAIERLESLMARDGGDPGVVALFATLARRMDRRAEAAAAVEDMLARDDLAVVHRRSLSFQLGMLQDSLGRYDAAFTAYRHGNSLIDQTYDHAANVAKVDAFKKWCTRACLARNARAGNRSDLPVFIVGMPRSGTTLVEQILDRHGSVHGAGELPHIRRIGETLAAEFDVAPPEALERVTADRLDGLAEEHLSFLTSLSGRGPVSRVVDKMPANHRHLALIQALFPGARIIHCRRRALDTCLSCYFQEFFEGGHGYASDLADLGAYYRLYEELMTHWRRELDLPILDIDYEDLVDNQEETSERMVAFLGLEWDARCLDFHRSTRTAHTASYDQVRQPIYRRSISRDRHYDSHLVPLIDALGESAQLGKV